MEDRERARVRSEISVAPLSEDDFPDISSLITGMVGFNDSELHLRDKSAKYYRWMYLDNPMGHAVVIGARHRGKLVASFAIAPKLMHLPGGERIVGKTMDMFTHPDYQGMGLMSMVASAAFAAAVDAGMNILFVTPSVNSYPIFKHKYGYREDFEVVYRAQLLQPGALLAWKLPALGKPLGRAIDAVFRLAGSVRRDRLPSGFVATVDPEFGEPEEELWRRVAQSFSVATVRSATYLNWRYSENPDEYTVLKLHDEGQLVAFIVLKETLRRGMRIGEIVDFVYSPQDRDTFCKLIRLAKSHFREAGVVLCETWAIPGSAQERHFIRAGLIHRRASLKFLLSPNFPAPVDRDIWLVTQGDGNDV